MPKYILRNFAPGTRYNNVKRSNNLFNLSNIGLDSNQNAIKTSIALGVSQTNQSGYDGGTGMSDYGDEFFQTPFARYRDVTKSNSEFVAFFNQTYSLRRDYLRQFAKNGEINFVLETIADEAIVYNENNYFCDLDLDTLKSGINAQNKYAEKLISLSQQSFKRVYSMYGFDRSNDAWQYFKKFLIDGFLAFEIIFEYDKNKQAQNIIAFKELDPVTLQPDIVKDQQGHDMKVWYQYKGDQERERIIPDANIIYLSWCRGNFIESSNISYLEGLTRSFNMLRQLENSRIIWNIENAQKRVKITVPVGGMSTDRARQRLSELRAYYNEETVIDDFSGEVTVNGMPKFSFTKTYLFPSQEGSQTEIGEIGTEGYDMNSTDQLKYFWRRFILETKVPANRFTLDPASAPNNALTGDSTVTREEYAFSRFIQRIQAAYKEIILKPLWIQICLKMPAIAASDYLKTCLGIKYNEENIFTLAKERAAVDAGATTVSNLSQIQGSDGKPYFNVDFLVKKYLGLTDEDIMLNKKYKEGDELKALELKKKQNANKPAEEENQTGEFTESNDFGGGMNDFGGGSNDFGGGGNDFTQNVSEPMTNETPAATETPAASPETPAE